MKKEDVEIGKWYYFETKVQSFSGQCWECFEAKNRVVFRTRCGQKYLVSFEAVVGETPDPRWLKIAKPPGH